MICTQPRRISGMPMILGPFCPYTRSLLPLIQVSFDTTAHRSYRRRRPRGVGASGERRPNCGVSDPTRGQAQSGYEAALLYNRRATAAVAGRPPHQGMYRYIFMYFLYVRLYIHTYIHTYIRMIHTYIHTHLHTYICMYALGRVTYFCGRNPRTRYQLGLPPYHFEAYPSLPPIAQGDSEEFFLIFF